MFVSALHLNIVPRVFRRLERSRWIEFQSPIAFHGYMAIQQVAVANFVLDGKAWHFTKRYHSFPNDFLSTWYVIAEDDVRIQRSVSRERHSLEQTLQYSRLASLFWKDSSGEHDFPLSTYAAVPVVLLIRSNSSLGMARSSVRNHRNSINTASTDLNIFRLRKHTRWQR